MKHKTTKKSDSLKNKILDFDAASISDEVYQSVEAIGGEFSHKAAVYALTLVKRLQEQEDPDVRLALTKQAESEFKKKHLGSHIKNTYRILSGHAIVNGFFKVFDHCQEKLRKQGLGSYNQVS